MVKTKLKDIARYLPIPTICRNCGAKVILVKTIFGSNLYKCTRCDSYVGTHGNTNIPLGILANKKERQLRQQCHDTFDKIWKNYDQRTELYKKLAKRLDIEYKDCHFGLLNLEQLQQANTIIKRMYKEHIERTKQSQEDKKKNKLLKAKLKEAI